MRKAQGPQLVVGLMSGTSADGVDAVVAKISGSGETLRARLIAHSHRKFSPALRRRVLAACEGGSVAEICQLNFLLGEEFARAALAVIRKAKLKPRDIGAIGSHGQTIQHLPRVNPPSTLQIGEAAVIRERTGITTVADFRVADMAAGGQGAPLVAFADWVLFRDATRPRIVQNIGGIANLTFLPPRANLRDAIAFDTGAGNMVIDALMVKLTRGKKTSDRDGIFAAHGKVCEKLLAQMMAHPFLRRRPPKTTGREEFGEPFVRRVLASAKKFGLRDADIVATATAFTAASIAAAYRSFLPPLGRGTQIILGGGGAKNPTLRRMIAERVGAEILTHEDFGIPNAAKEAFAFAILAHETLRGAPSNVPSATGARRAVVLGKIVHA